MKRVHITVYGKVQGVSFRYYSKQKALELGVKGWVMNLRNPNIVELVIEGKDEKVDKMIEWCSHGPQNAIIEKIDVTEEEYKGEFNSFEVRYW
ncbi:acylphosphatase [Candidatus Woesearchaeota archaeon]|nr:MAG: acylphosphatase [Candidatus Woesearchaeota archaeon]